MLHKTSYTHGQMSLTQAIKVAVMQGNSRQVSGCGAKRRFGCKDVADEFLTHKGLLSIMHSYHCDYCQFWHIGHPKHPIG